MTLNIEQLKVSILSVKVDNSINLVKLLSTN